MDVLCKKSSELILMEYTSEDFNDSGSDDSNVRKSDDAKCR